MTDLLFGWFGLNQTSKAVGYFTIAKHLNRTGGQMYSYVTVINNNYKVCVYYIISDTVVEVKHKLLQNNELDKKLSDQS